MITSSALVLIITLMVIMTIYENFVYFKKLYQLISETVWKEANMTGESQMSDVEFGGIKSFERMAMIFMLCVTSVLLWRNFDHYRITIGKYTKEEFEKNLASVEKRLQQRLDVVENKIKEFEIQYSRVDVETIYTREGTVPEEQSKTITNDACHQTDIGADEPRPTSRKSCTLASGLVVDQSSQTSWPPAADVTQQLTAVPEVDTPRSVYSVPATTTVGVEHLPARQAASWYEEVQKEEMLMSNQDACNLSMIGIDYGNTPIGVSWSGYDMDVNQYPEIEYKLHIHSVLESADFPNDQSVRPGSGEVEENSSNTNNNYSRQIPRYHGAKKGNSKQHHNIVKNSHNEENFFMNHNPSDSTNKPGRNSRQSTPRHFTAAEGGEFCQVPTRRRKPRTYNAK